MISREKFARYVELQNTGQVNMCDIGAVVILTGLDGDVVKEIQDTYELLAETYPTVVS